MQPGFIKSRPTVQAVAAYALCAFAGAASQVRPATAATDPFAGVADSMGAAAGGMVDLQLTEIAEVVAGGTLAAGDPVTADASAHAVKAVKQAGATVYVAGIAQEPALAGDITRVLVAPSLIVG